MQVQLNASSHLAKRVTFYWQQMFKEAIKCAISYLRQYGGLPFTPVPEIVPPPTQIVRDVQASSLVQALGLAVNPLYGQDPKLLFEQWLQANQFDPSRTELSPERLAQLQQLSQPQPDEKALATLESAKVRAEANVQAAAVDAGAKQQQTALNAENEARKREHERAMKEMDYKMRLLEYASQRQIDLQMAAAEMGAAGGEESETTSNTAK
jgi:4-amino-4-deoxy-L-arabinose transferase-like glycosyltransferase